MALCRDCFCWLTARDVRLYSSQCEDCARADEEAETAYVEQDAPATYIDRIRGGQD